MLINSRTDTFFLLGFLLSAIFGILSPIHRRIFEYRNGNPSVMRREIKRNLSTLDSTIVLLM